MFLYDFNGTRFLRSDDRREVECVCNAILNQNLIIIFKRQILT